MRFIYHRVPDNLQGNTLYPLNMLKDVYPGIYTKAASKYDGREHVPKQRIPLFGDCLWNDVLFFTAVDPALLLDERRKAGFTDFKKPQQFFKIDPRALDQSKLGVFLFQPWVDAHNYTAESFTNYRYDDLATYATIPQETKDYFAAESNAGAPYIKLLWRYIPHILYRGEIPIAETEIIIVS